jgi:hypothetical protein
VADIELDDERVVSRLDHTRAVEVIEKLTVLSSGHRTGCQWREPLQASQFAGGQSAGTHRAGPFGSNCTRTTRAGRMISSLPGRWYAMAVCPPSVVTSGRQSASMTGRK